MSSLVERKRNAGPAEGTYVPRLPPTAAAAAARTAADAGRADGRSPLALRALIAAAGPVTAASGSGAVEAGAIRIIAAAYGPRPFHVSAGAAATETVTLATVPPVRVAVSHAPFSGPPGTRRTAFRGAGTRDADIARAVAQGILPALVPADGDAADGTGTGTGTGGDKATVDVHVMVLSADGASATQAACVTACGLALADAGVRLRDVPVGVSAGVVHSAVVLDLTHAEETRLQDVQTAASARPTAAAEAGGGMWVTYLPRTRELAHIQQYGVVDGALLGEMLDACTDAASRIADVIEKELLRSVAEGFAPVS
ncbi:hypothetical protein CXG81DRAFT_25227 [Caulochytrium protostelioides]|uniref:Exoribonuclease phosphorolytic domain-containing protein n=1 Tax=Caulochytrium protostelioides TaxID=1555241 RepID=A0A4P9XA03_9FUNG|nr:hypothetical protein CXG81DRAFT_25227 [Caulochytrium protostelioides]|eukprot:RKP02142.1 hypothetical protein CXG81DRAFT_25227 [Caulochytrium protostelioides]